MLEACALTDPGKVRTTNQDSFRIVPELGLYVIADGMGGARGGAHASQIAVETVADILGKSQHRDAAALLGAVEEANQLLDEIDVHGLSHITGGGLIDNIPRVVPEGLEVVLERRAWGHDPVFEWLQRAGRIAEPEMYRVFNCGIGMTVHVAHDDADRAMAMLRESGQPSAVIGEIRKGGRGVVIT